MLTKNVKIGTIPAIVWGEESKNVIIAVHGSKSNKKDVPIELLAKNMLYQDYQVLSFDLPKHGDRQEEDTPFDIYYCLDDLKTVMAYAKENWEHISLFGVSIGAFYSIMAYREEPVERALFLSPMVEMKTLILNMMKWFNVSEERLKEEQAVETPMGETLYWDYYRYVLENPVDKWDVPTEILYGNKDDLSAFDLVEDFAKRFSCKLEIVDGAEHYFHTPEQLRALDKWIKKSDFI